MQNHSNLYRTMMFGLSLLAGGQFAYTSISADVNTSSSITSSEMRTSSEMSSEQIDQNASRITSSNESSATDSLSDEEPSESSIFDSEDSQSELSSRTVTKASSINNQTGYINVPGVGWRWLEKGQLYSGFRYYMGAYYWFQNGVRQNNQWETAWGHKYYVGADGESVKYLV